MFYVCMNASCMHVRIYMYVCRFVGVLAFLNREIPSKTEMRVVTELGCVVRSIP